MLKWLFRWGKKKQVLEGRDREGSLLISDLPADAVRGIDNPQVVPLRSPENGSAFTRRKDGSELFTEAVNKLVDKLEGINANLDRQVCQNERLVTKMDGLPELLARLPQTMERQEHFLDEISGQIRQRAVQDEQTFRELSGIHEKITSCAELDARMSDHIGDVAQSMNKMSESTLGQTELLQHLNRSWLSTEQYLRESLQQQQLRFYWLFSASLVISLVAISGVVIALYALFGR